MATEQTHRANVVGPPQPCSPAILPGEVIVGADGQYLGDFSSEYLASARFDVRYPVGWTGGTWYEQPAARTDLDVGLTCVCTDCRGSTFGRFIQQRQPDEHVLPTDATIFDYWNYAIHPQHYTGEPGCSYVFDDSYSCVSGSTFYTGLCQPNLAAHDSLHYEPACWPLVPFALANPSSRIRVVTDTSGPTEDECVQEELALEIDFAGNGAEGASFVGEGGGYDADRCGADSSANNGWTGSERSATGWTIERDTCWRVRFWIKAVPDNDDFVCSGYDWQFNSGFWPYTYVEERIDGDRVITLTDEWQLYDFTWTATFPSPPNPSFPEPITNVPLVLYTLTTSENLPDERPFYRRQGRVHVKHVSVIPCTLSEGVHVKRYSAEVF